MRSTDAATRCYILIVTVVFSAAGCSTDCCNNEVIRHRFADDIDLSIAVPSQYVREESWSPESDILKFTHPDETAIIFFEFGPSGYPDYHDKRNYVSTTVSINKVDGELIRFSDDKRDSLNETMILRFRSPNSARAWAYYQSDLHDEVENILRSFRWYGD